MDKGNRRVVALIGFSLLEIFLFGGLHFGWFAFVFILKQEGVFGELCVLKDDFLKSNISSENATTTTTTINIDCFPQDERLNLIFSIGIAVFLTLTFLSGQLYMAFGITRIRMLYMALGVAGFLCFAFTSPGAPWLPLPGIILVGVAGQALLISNYMQVIPLLPRGSSIYVGLINGCLDSSVLTMMIVKSLYEDGIDKEFSLIGLTILFVVVAGVCTLLHPKNSQRREVSAAIDMDIKGNEGKEESLAEDINKRGNIAMSKEMATEDMRLVKHKQNNCVTDNVNKEELTSGDADLTSGEMLNMAMGEVLCHRLFISHVVWFNIGLLKLNFFIGSANRFMGQILQDNSRVSYFTDVLTYTLLGSLVSSFIAGYTTQATGKLFTGILGTVIPLLMASCLSILLSALEFVTTATALYADSIVLTFLRSFLFVVNVEYCRIIFPAKYISIVYGLILSISGIMSLTQYGLFAWTDGYDGATTHVKLFMLCLTTVSLSHPFLVFDTYRRRRRYINKIEGVDK